MLRQAGILGLLVGLTGGASGCKPRSLDSATKDDDSYANEPVDLSLDPALAARIPTLAADLQRYGQPFVVMRFRECLAWSHSPLSCWDRNPVKGFLRVENGQIVIPKDGHGLERLQFPFHAERVTAAGRYEATKAVYLDSVLRNDQEMFRMPAEIVNALTTGLQTQYQQETAKLTPEAAATEQAQRDDTERQKFAYEANLSMMHDAARGEYALVGTPDDFCPPTTSLVVSPGSSERDLKIAIDDGKGFSRFVNAEQQIPDFFPVSNDDLTWKRAGGLDSTHEVTGE
jgi:hypothetical protein